MSIILNSKFSKGCVIAKVDPIASSSIESVNNLVKAQKQIRPRSGMPMLMCPLIIGRNTKINKNLYACVDSELGHTDIVTIKFDMDNNSPIHLRP